MKELVYQLIAKILLGVWEQEILYQPLAGQICVVGMTKENSLYIQQSVDGNLVVILQMIVLMEQDLAKMK